MLTHTYTLTYTNGFLPFLYLFLSLQQHFKAIAIKFESHPMLMVVIKTG